MATIYEIQGAGHTSPLVGQTVTAEGGIVTAVLDNGFYIQDPTGDGDPSTADGLFIFTGNDEPTVSVGDAVNVTGEISEFQPGGEDNRNLTGTQIAFPDNIEILSNGNDLPSPVVIGAEGRIPPSENIDDDGFAEFNPTEAGIDFFESLEGMLVTAQEALAIAPTNRFGEIFTVVNNGNEATGISDRGTLNISPDDFNPEKVQIDAERDLLPDFDFPEVSVGAQLGNVTGVVGYSFGNFEIYPTQEFTVTASDLEPETTMMEAGGDSLTLASYNVLNLDPNDEDGEDTDVADGRFTAIAEQIVNNLNTPDVIGLQEIQDNDGEIISDIGAADETLQLLVDEIVAAGGPAYAFIDTEGIVPAFEDEDGNVVRPTGGAPGGNIRNAFLYNPERVSLVDSEPLTDPQDQATNPDNPFFGSRIPLSATFEFNGEEVTVISNHFSSKGGSSAILGLDQPFEELQNGAQKDLPQATLDDLDPADRFVNGSYNEREAQAQALKDFVDGLSTDNIVALGDFNEFEFVDIVQDTLGSSLTNLVETLPEDERYSFIFQGNSQTLDHILVSDTLAETAQFDIVHVNAEFPDTAQKASDHEPLLASVNLTSDIENMAINLTPIGTFETGVFDEGAAEIVAYDASSDRLFVINSDATTVDILDVSDPTTPTLISQINATDFGDGANSVAVNDGIVAVAIEGEAVDANGQVVFFDTDGNVLNNVTVGILPDMVTFSPDGTKVLTANEGEPNDDYTIDPEGSVSIIDISGGVENATVANADFTAFNDQQVALENRGLRIFGPNATVAQDVEPEYITVPNNSTAYVSLQENNALAVVDLENAEVLDILPLGFKDHSKGLPTLEEFPISNELLEANPLPTPDGASDIPLGGLSGLFYEGTDEDGNLQFITHPDRGPDLGSEDTDSDGENDVRVFALPDFQPTLYRFDFNPENGEITITETIGLTRADGTPLTGLPNLEGDDSDRQGAEQLEDGTIQTIDFDPFGADMEGVVVNPADGTFWTVDEYRPSIYHFETDGTLIERYVPQGTDPDPDDDVTYGAETLPEAYLSARDNRGFEAVSLDTDEGILYAFIQTPLGNDGTGEFNSDVSANSSVIRMLGIDPADGTPVAEYVYLLENPAFSEGNIDKIGDATYAGDGKFFVIERDSGTNPTSGKAVYEINLSGATNVLGQTFEGTTLEQLDADGLAAADIRPVSKTEVTNLASLGYLPSDKPEGLALLDDGSLAVLNDNDFEPEDKDTSLGIVSFDKSNQLDASDEDGINLQNIPSFGMLQPDSIDSFTVGEQAYIITANEGDARDYDTFSEEASLEDLLNDGLLDLDDDNTVDTGDTVISTGETVNDLLAEDRLGEIDFTNATGDIDGDGLIEQLYNYGGRSFSIFDEFGNLVFDSGDEFERITAELIPNDFNSDNDENDSFDSRSDAKGPEPEAVVTGEVNGTPYAFIGLERVGGIMVYDLSNPSAPEFVQYVNNRNFRDDNGDPIPVQLDDESVNPAVGDLGPEGFDFISAEDSPTGEPLLAVGNEVSGTTTIYSVADMVEGETFTLELFHAADQEPLNAGANFSDITGLSAVLNALEGEDLGDDGVEDNTLVLSSGDVVIPGLFYSASEAVFGAPGIADILIQNELGFEAIAFGNHEFDDGTAVLAGLIDGSAGSETALEESQEVHDVPDTDAEGEFTVTLINGNELIIEGSFSDLSADVFDTSPDGVDSEGNPIDFIHIHNAPAGENGPVIRAFDATVDESGRAGTFSGTFTLTEEEVAELEAGNLYVNLHTDTEATRPGELRGQIILDNFDGANFPYLSTNLDVSTDGNLAPLEVEGGQAPQPNSITSSVVIDVNGEEIGVVGATTPTLASISSPGSVSISPSPFGANPTSEELDALAAEIQLEVDALLDANQDMNKVILLAHMQQLSIEQELAQRLENVDIIVGGGSNTRLFDENDRVRDGDSNQGEYPQFFTNAGGTQTALVNTDGSYKYLGRLVLDFDSEGNIIPESYDSEVSGAYATDAQGVADLNAEGLIDPEIQNIVNQIEAQVILTESNVFGLSDVFLNGNRSGGPLDGVRTQETNLGNLTADANLAAAQQTDPEVVVSLKNGGGIRASIGETIVPAGGSEAVRTPNSELVDGDGEVIKPEGGISQTDIETTLAFNNGLTLLTVTKEELVGLLEHGVSALPDVSGRFPQISGVEFSFNPELPAGDRIVDSSIVDDDGNTVTELLSDGEIVGDPAETFRIVTLGFLAAPRFNDDGEFTGGGDGYPFPNTNADPEVGEVGDPDVIERVNLVQLEQEGVRTGTATFADDGSEQDALAEYLAANFPADDDPNTPVFGNEDTPVSEDTRIVNLAVDDEPEFRSDFTGDGLVNLNDLGIFAAAFGSAEGEDNFNPATDLTGDGLVNLNDLGIFASEFSLSV